MSTNGDGSWYDRLRAAGYIGRSVRTVDRRFAEGRLGGFQDPVTKAVRFHRDDLESYLAKQRVEPLDDVLDNLSDSTRLAFCKALPRLRRDAVWSIAALIAIAKYSPERVEDAAQAILAGATELRVVTGRSDAPEFVLTENAERLRRQWLMKNRDPRGGATDPWAVSHVISPDLWRLLEPSLDSGVIFLAASRNMGFRLGKGDSSSFWPYFGARGGYAPCTRQPYEQLLEHSADFRQAIADQTIVEIVRPGADA
jgi:hypothetical protein